jgi:hypothetical protein
MDEAIQEGIGQGRVADEIRPMLPGIWAGHEGRVPVIALLQKLEPVTPFTLFQGGEAESIEDQEVGVGQVSHPLGITPLALGWGQLWEELG